MKKISYILTFTLALFLLTASNAQQDEYSYVGVKKCKMCHSVDKKGNQYEVWKNSQHADAYNTLTTEEADKVAEENGLDTPASENSECLKCHVTGYTEEADLDKDNGVQCESCHGPGSGYFMAKKPGKSREENREAAVEKGLVIHENLEEYCTKCHNEESPTFEGFNFEESFEKIKHYIPEQ